MTMTPQELDQYEGRKVAVSTLGLGILRGTLEVDRGTDVLGYPMVRYFVRRRTQGTQVHPSTVVAIEEL